MKKLFVIVLAASLAGACGSKKADTTPKAAEPKAPDAGYGGATYGAKPAPPAANPCASQGH